MHESVQSPIGASLRRVVDHLCARADDLLERRLNIIHFNAQVMQARAFFSQIFRHTARFVERRDQLNFTVTNRQKSDVHLLTLVMLHVMQGQTERVLPEIQRRIDILDHDGNMINLDRRHDDPLYF